MKKNHKRKYESLKLLRSGIYTNKRESSVSNNKKNGFEIQFHAKEMGGGNKRIRACNYRL